MTGVQQNSIWLLAVLSITAMTDFLEGRSKNIRMVIGRLFPWIPMEGSQSLEIFKCRIPLVSFRRCFWLMALPVCRLPDVPELGSARLSNRSDPVVLCNSSCACKKPDVHALRAAGCRGRSVSGRG